MIGLTTGLDELEALVQARYAEIDTLLQSAPQSPDAQTLAQLDSCLQAGALLQQHLGHVRNHLSGELHHLKQLAQASNQNVPDNVSGDPGQPRIQTLELHG